MAILKRKRKYPKSKETIFIEFGEFDCRQLNIHYGREYNYWFLQRKNLDGCTLYKLPKGNIPYILKGKDLSKLTHIN